MVLILFCAELLRRSSEQILVEMVQLLFTRLPQFKEDAKWSANMRKVRSLTCVACLLFIKLINLHL